MYDNSKTIRALELNKILERLAERAICPDTQERALEIEPAKSYAQACRELAMTNEAYSMLKRFSAPALLAIKSPVNSLKRAEAGAQLTMLELLRIAQVLRTVRGLTQYRNKNENEESILDEMFSSLSPNKPLETHLTSCILSEEEMADDASDELYSIRRKIKRAQSRARDQLDRIIHSSTYAKFLQDQIVTIRDGRFVVPVRAECRGEIKGLVHDTSASGATVFVEPMAVVEANNEIRVLEQAEQQEIDRILRQLSGEVGIYAQTILVDYDTILEIDLLFAKAKLADEMRAVLPELNNEGKIELRKARHPLIAKNQVVPTDIRLGEEFDTLVITGPNTGGKTVSIKTLGLLTLMAMCGLMIPAAEGSRISYFSQVLVDIGDEQSIEQNLSTFSAHMTNIRAILEQADDQSLVLLDELGAGTDPVEGAALATAILEQLRVFGCKITATTHYAELKIFALQTPGVENASCEFDVATLRPTYRLLIGVPGRSNAFAISKRLGISDAIIERARELVSSDSARFEDVVEGLESTRQKLENERAAIAEQERETARLKAEAAKLRKNLESIREQEMERARTQAKKIVSDVQLQSQKLLEELEEIRKQKNKEQFGELTAMARGKTRQKLKELSSKADPVAERTNEGYVLPRALRIGDTVLLVDLNKKATVLELPDNSGNVLVQAGLIRTTVKQSNLKLVEGQAEKPKQNRGGGYTTSKSKATRKVSTELDLRGMNAEEAILDLDQFLDNAVLTGINMVTVIHGKGTGVLRSAVQTFLRRNKHVRTFRLGTYGEGESGVTIVELK